MFFHQDQWESNSQKAVLYWVTPPSKKQNICISPEKIGGSDQQELDSRNVGGIYKEGPGGLT